MREDAACLFVASIADNPAGFSPPMSASCWWGDGVNGSTMPAKLPSRISLILIPALSPFMVEFMVEGVCLLLAEY